jgi:hypothetical protein
MRLAVIYLIASLPGLAIAGVSTYLVVTASPWWVLGIILGACFMPQLGDDSRKGEA